MPTGWTATTEVAKIVEAAGFLYDSHHDIIYSRMNALQRHFGYSLLYDDVAPVTISAIIDCEPVYFNYGGKKWMIEFWKGQYGLETGAEIGVYNVEPGHQVNKVIDRLTSYIPGASNPVVRAILERRSYSFYECASDAELLEMSFVLCKNGQTIFGRGPEKHWWLTGFKWGICSDPSELSVKWKITFPTKEMCSAFKHGLRKSLYLFLCNSTDRTVRLTYACPHFFPQPVGRYALRDPVMAHNRQLVETYNELKRQLGITSNDPNLFKAEDAQRIDVKPLYDSLLGYLKTLTDDVENLQKLWDDQVG